MECRRAGALIMKTFIVFSLVVLGTLITLAQEPSVTPIFTPDGKVVYVPLTQKDKEDIITRATRDLALEKVEQQRQEALKLAIARLKVSAATNKDIADILLIFKTLRVETSQ